MYFPDKYGKYGIHSKKKTMLNYSGTAIGESDAKLFCEIFRTEYRLYATRTKLICRNFYGSAYYAYLAEGRYKLWLSNYVRIQAHI